MSRYGIPKKDSVELNKNVQNSSKENTIKYGYYDISLYIRNLSLKQGALKSVVELLLLTVNNIEITGVFLAHYTAGFCAFSKVNIGLLPSISDIENQIDSVNAKAYIKVDESDMKMSLTDIDENAARVDYKGSLIDRFVQQGLPKEEVESIFVPITEEEYERYAIEVDKQIIV